MSSCQFFKFSRVALLQPAKVFILLRLHLVDRIQSDGARKVPKRPVRVFAALAD